MHEVVFQTLAAAPPPQHSLDLLRKLRSLLPLLEEAITKRRTRQVWVHTYPITGPLSWIDFHRHAGRSKTPLGDTLLTPSCKFTFIVGAEETSEPLPVPTVLVGFEKENLALTPQSIQHWVRQFEA